MKSQVLLLIVSVLINNPLNIEVEAQSVPSAPCNFTLSSILGSPTQLSASWCGSIFNSTNGTIIAYSVYCNTTTNQPLPEQNTGPNVPTIRSTVNGTTLSTKLTGLNPYTQYSCYVIANTSAGQGSPSALAIGQTAQSVPSSPQNFTVSPVAGSSTQLFVRWSIPIPRNGIITGYSVYCNTSANQTYPEQVIGPNVPIIRSTVNGTTLATTLIGLNPYTQYSCYVTANTSVGQGNPSVLISAQSGESVPSTPKNFTVSSVPGSSTQLSASWSIPIPRNGIITGYSVYCNISANQTYPEQVIGPNVPTVRATVNGTTLATTLTGLNPYTQYSCYVTANTSVGEGSPSNLVSNKTVESAPSSPQNFTVSAVTGSPTQLSIRWSIPIPRNGIITGYSVYCNISDIQTYPEQVIGPNAPTIRSRMNGTTLATTLTGLNPYTQYSCYVTANTSVGEGSPSLVVSAQTGESASSPPTPLNVTAYNISSTSIMVTWQRPLYPNGAIRGYQIRYIPQGGNTSLLNVSSTNLSVLLDGLQVYKTYNISLRVLTVVYSNFSAILTVSTDEGASSAPLNVTVYNITSTSSTVQWQPPLQVNGILRGYTVTYTCQGGNNTTFVTNTSTILNFLKPFTMYTIIVVARTKVHGTPSIPVNVYTAQDVPAGPVENLGVLQLSFTTITLMWQPPAVPNGVITQYQVTWGSSLTFNVTTPLFVVVPDLNLTTSYTFNLTAWTIVGPGPSTTLQSSTAQIPNVTGVSVIALNKTAVQVSWMRIGIPSDGTIVGYTVLYAAYGNSKRQSVDSYTQFFEGDVTQGVVGNLNPFQPYHFSVAAKVSVKGQTYLSASPQLGQTSLLYNPSSTTSAGGPQLTSEILAGSLVAEFVVLLLVMILVVVVVLLVMKRRLKQKYELDGVHQNGGSGLKELSLGTTTFHNDTRTMEERNSCVMTERNQGRYDTALRAGLPQHTTNTISSQKGKQTTLKGNQQTHEDDEWPDQEETYQECDFQSSNPTITDARQSTAVTRNETGTADCVENTDYEMNDMCYENKPSESSEDVNCEENHEAAHPEFSLYDVVENECIYDSVN